MNMKIGSVIKSEVEFASLDQKQAAEILEIEYSTFCNYLNNAREPDFATLIHICKYFNLDLNGIFGLKATNQDFSITKDEAHLLAKYRTLNHEQKKTLIKFNDNLITVLKES